MVAFLKVPHNIPSHWGNGRVLKGLLNNAFRGTNKLTKIRYYYVSVLRITIRELFIIL